MQCTAEEIERKRKFALEKLNGKIKFPSPNQEKLNNVSPFKFNSINSSKSPLKKSINAYKPYSKIKPTLFYGETNVVTCTCALMSENRFVVNVSAYSVPTIEIFKTIKSKSYGSINAKIKQWNFDVSDYDVLLTKLGSLYPDVIVNKLPPFVIKCCKMPKCDYSTIDLSSIEKELISVLMPFQIDGVCFGIDKNGRCLIADEMGLGKTFQALAIAHYYIDDWPLLIVTTASMKNEWESTIHKYIPSISIMHTQYITSAKDYIGDCKILICSYEMMVRCLDKLLLRNFKIIIVDESHTLKNFKSKCTKAATDLSKKAKRIILLSGTPALSRPSELYTQLAMLDENFFGNFFEYSKRYCDGQTTSFGWNANGKSNLQELEIILAKKFMIRRTKRDVLKNIPNKEQHIVELDVKLNQFSDEDRKYLDDLSIKYNSQKKATDKHAALLTFFSETGRIKIPSVCSFILQALGFSQKCIIFAHHKKMLNAIEEVFGSTKKIVDEFQLNDNCMCAILSITAANAGITLTAAKLVIFAELHWNPSILSQAESRAHRIGQDEKVIVKYLVAPGTADDSIWRILQDKQKILKEAGLFQDSFENLDVIRQDLTTSSRSPTKFNNIENYLNKQVPSGSGNKTESEFFSDDLDDNLANFNIPDSGKENMCGGSSMKNELFNDGLDDLLVNHNLENNVNESFKRMSADDSADVIFMDDGFDEMISNVQLNI
ncbi:hypothetical protein FQR65_LT08623 [Abscondita terminalis]|nr:hypothetical protein FQR65_LT08623 [Abscondita terminalis]